MLFFTPHRYAVSLLTSSEMACILFVKLYRCVFCYDFLEDINKDKMLFFMISIKIIRRKKILESSQWHRKTVGGYFKEIPSLLTSPNELQHLTALTSWAIWDKKKQFIPLRAKQSRLCYKALCFYFQQHLLYTDGALLFLWLKVFCSSQNVFMSSLYHVTN